MNAAVQAGSVGQALISGKLPEETFRLFFKNWAAYTIEINTLEAASYHKHIHFFRKHRDLMAAMAEKLADYAEKTEQTENLVQALASHERTDASETLQAALTGCSSPYGRSRSRK